MTVPWEGDQAGLGLQGDLAAAVDQLYLAFSGCPKPSRIDGCPHWMRSDADQALLGVPLRELEHAALGGTCSRRC